MLKLPFFYGWVIVSIAMLAGFLGAGISNITMSVVLKPLSTDLGWSRTLTSSAITIGSVTGGLLAPVVGPLADRFGPRFLLPLGAALVGAFAIGVSLTAEPWNFYATFVPARAFAELLLVGVVPTTAVANWFYRKRPRAIGFVALSVPLGSFALSLVYQFLISVYGWRAAFWTLGICLWLFVAVPGVLFLRRQPEDLGMLPDGVAGLLGDREDASLASGARELETQRSWSRRAALRTSTLWLLIAASTLASMATGGIAFHLVAFYTDLSIEPAVAVGALSLMALTGAFGNGLWGALAEKFDARALSIAAMLLSAAAVALLIQVRAASTAYLFAFLFGVNARGGFVLTHILFAQNFGRRSFGAIASILEPFHKGGLGLGALMAGMAFDLTGGYETVFGVFLGNYALAALLTFLARRPDRPTSV
jgi:MFS family permease